MLDFTKVQKGMIPVAVSFCLLLTTDLPGQTVKLVGTVKSVRCGKIYFNNDESDKIDSATILNGKFILETELNEPAIYTIYIDQLHPATYQMILQRGDNAVNIDSSGLHFLRNDTLNLKLQAFNKHHLAFRDAILRLSPKQGHEEKENSNYYKRNAIYRKFIKYCDSTILSNRNNIVSVIILNQYVIATHYLDYLTVDSLYQKIDNRIKGTYYGHEVQSYVNRAFNLKKGKRAPDFKLTDFYGNERSLSDLKGKYVLLHFWASWCLPCRATNSRVIKLTNELGNLGFVVVNVSLDANEKKWRSAVVKDNLESQVNLIAGDGFDSEICKKYNVLSIPATFLIDRNGKILETKPSDEQIVEHLLNDVELNKNRITK